MFDRRERRTLFTQNRHGGTYIFRLHEDSRANIVVNHLLDKDLKRVRGNVTCLGGIFCLHTCNTKQ